MLMLLFIVTTVLVMVLVIPIWALVDAYRNPNLTRFQRSLWRLLCLISIGVGSSIYGIVKGRSRALRVTSIVALTSYAAIIAWAFLARP